MTDRPSEDAYMEMRGEIKSMSDMSEDALDSAACELQSNCEVFCRKTFGFVPSDPVKYFEDMLWEWYWRDPRWDLLGVYLNGLTVRQLYLVLAWKQMSDARLCQGFTGAAGRDPMRVGFELGGKVALSLSEAQLAPGHRR